MAFTASKIRKIHVDAIGRGTPIIPSAAIESWYRDQLQPYADEMVAEYRREINAALTTKQVEKFYAMDASAASILTSVLDRLKKRWTNIFRGLAATISPKFVDKAEKAATASTVFSLSAAGVKQPKAAYTLNVRNTMQAAVAYNNTLISNVPIDTHEKVFNAVMLSLTSPDPKEQGASGIETALHKIGGFTESRIKLIANDQTSKLYCSLSDERMLENGVEEFEWQHSSAGKEPRHSHVLRNGQVYKINDPRLWDGPKADAGPPAWAINCRCRRIPIIR